MALAFARLRRKLSTSSIVRVRYISLSAHPKPSEELTPDPRFLRHGSPEARLLDHSPFLRFPQVRVTTLPNGIRVVTQSAPLSASHTASIGVWIDSGSRFEAPGTNGTAHFLEHMIFKGTGHRTARSLEEEIENMGGRLNAYTSREQTTYYADVQSKDVPVAVDVLADILQNSRFPDHAIRRERGVILREMEEVQGQMEEVIFDHLHSASFCGHPLGDTILGPEENIRAISRIDLQQYIYTHYMGPRMVVSAAGAVKHDEIVDMVSRLFRNFSRDPTTAEQLVEANPAIFTGSEVRVENEDMPLVHLAIAFRGAAWADPNSIPLMVIQSLLGSWNKSMGVGNCSGSQLACRASTDNLAESIMAFNTNYCDIGLFGIYSTAMPDHVHDLSCLLMEEMRRLAYKVSETEVLRARNQLKSALLLHIDGSTAVAENNGRQVYMSQKTIFNLLKWLSPSETHHLVLDRGVQNAMPYYKGFKDDHGFAILRTAVNLLVQMLTYGRVMPFLELFTRIDAVDADTVMETAKNFIIDKDVAIAAVGPLHLLPAHNWFRSQISAE